MNILKHPYSKIPKNARMYVVTSTFLVVVRARFSQQAVYVACGTDFFAKFVKSVTCADDYELKAAPDFAIHVQTTSADYSVQVLTVL